MRLGSAVSLPVVMTKLEIVFGCLLRGFENGSDVFGHIVSIFLYRLVEGDGLFNILSSENFVWLLEVYRLAEENDLVDYLIIFK